MKAPIKKLQNKYRLQILMRINADDEKLLREIYNCARKSETRNVFVSFEVNPNNLT